MPIAGRPKIPKWVLHELLEHDLTVRKLALKYGVSHKTISRLLRGYNYKKSGIHKELYEQLQKDFPFFRSIFQRLYPKGL